MVVIDSSALIPLARTGNLNLLKQFKELKTTSEIKEEVIDQGKGKKGTSDLKRYFKNIEIKEVNTKETEELAELEGVTKADASLILLAQQEDEVLLTNDKVLIQITRMKNTKYYWLTTLILKSIKNRHISRDEGKQILYELVQEGMNLKNQVYAKILRKIDEM